MNTKYLKNGSYGLLAAVAVVGLSGCGTDTATSQTMEEPMMAEESMMDDMAGSDAMANDNMAMEMETKMVGGAEMYPSKNIVENAMNSEDHTTLVAAVQAAGLVETLQSEGSFTVFAPTNAAFEALPAGTVEVLLKPENKDRLTKILTYHVVPVKAMSGDVMQMIADDGGAHEVTTVSGDTLILKTMDGMVTVTDEMGNVATVTIADVEQSNGVIHVIDTVLMPQS